MALSPLETFRKTTNALYILVDGGKKYVVKHYRGPGNLARRRQEELSLTHWKKAGFNAPEIHDLRVPGVPEPYLVTSFIEGLSLREYLCAGTHAVDERFSTLEMLFRELAGRHEFAVNANDCNLIHHDPSSGNIICSEDGFYFVDFEAPLRKRRSALESASIEVATTCRWIVRDLGIESIEQVLKLLVVAYASQEPLLKLIVDRTTARPFQFFHRWKNRKRKLLRPDEVTKYDIADELAKLKIHCACY